MNTISLERRQSAVLVRVQSFKSASCGIRQTGSILSEPPSSVPLGAQLIPYHVSITSGGVPRHSVCDCTRNENAPCISSRELGVRPADAVTQILSPEGQANTELCGMVSSLSEMGLGKGLATYFPITSIPAQLSVCAPP